MAYQSALAALADPTRREILERLRSGPRAVGVLAEGLPVSRPAVSQHLRVLREAGLVNEQRQGTRRMYGLEARGLVELRRYLDRFWGDVLDAFKAEADGGLPPSGKKRRRPSPARKGRKHVR